MLNAYDRAAPKPIPVPAQPIAPRALTINDIDGQAALLANDGTYLGLVSSNSITADSICNPIGQYGSRISSRSVRNTIGTYGSSISSESAYNAITSTPPMIIRLTDGARLGYLTKNQILPGHVDPDVLFVVYGCPLD
jgi:hypothetical protein